MQIIAVFRSLLAPGLPWEIGKSAHWHLQPPPPACSDSTFEEKKAQRRHNLFNKDHKRSTPEASLAPP